jgi:hypothetical protein
VPFLRRTGSSLPSLLAILSVISAYVFFASAGTWELRRVAFTDTHYANLTEGFRRGQLSMAIEPVPCVEAGLARMQPFRIVAMAMACYSAVLGFLLGFAGPEKSFATANPELFRKLAALF